MKNYGWKIIVLLFATSCHRGDPGVNIDITKSSSGYRLTFRSCRNHKVGVSWIHVTEGVTGGADAPPHCEVLAPDPATRRIVDEWEYGTTPSGYTLSTCKPLQPGSVYEVQVDGAGGGRRVFSLSASGSIELREGSCSN